MPLKKREFYEMRAKSLIKELREQKHLSYKQLALRLEAEGVNIDAQVLINRINQGKFSFVFALQLLGAMGVDTIEVPKPHRPVAKKPA
jgi:transcriptional regulator with XRE-family HTH domain